VLRAVSVPTLRVAFQRGITAVTGRAALAAADEGSTS
jgi:hypothetical protein